MRIAFRPICALLLSVFLASCAPAKGAPPRLKEALEKDAFDVGEDIRLLITARAAPGTLWRWFPPQEELFGMKLESHDVRTADRSWGSSLRVYVLLRSFEPGEHEIPALSVGYRPRNSADWQEISTQPHTFTVKDRVEGDVLTLDIKDIKGPLRRRNILAWTLGTLLAAAAAALGMLRWVRRRRATAALPKPAPAPDETALKKIRALIAKDYIGRGLASQFYYELSLIVREYLEARFAIRAPEMTTEEFLEHLRGASALAPAHKELLKDFLTHCDLVKFARYAPGPPEIQAAVASARRLIEETKMKKSLGSDLEM